MFFIVTNTFSRDAARLNKFRVIIPFAERRRASVNFMRSMMKLFVVSRLMDIGNRLGASMDQTLMPGDWIALPVHQRNCSIGPAPTSRIPKPPSFASGASRNANWSDMPPTPNDIAKNTPVAPLAAPMPLPAAKTDQERVDKAIRQWHEVGGKPGNGNSVFFNLGLGLAYAGVPDNEIEQTLNDQSQYAQSPKDRRRNIPRIVRSIRRGRQG
jgi:hypothetical protein